MQYLRQDLSEMPVLNGVFADHPLTKTGANMSLYMPFRYPVTFARALRERRLQFGFFRVQGPGGSGAQGSLVQGYEVPTQIPSEGFRVGGASEVSHLGSLMAGRKPLA